MNQVDVAVIGAGPAGGAAALALAQSGLRVAVLEQARLPRRKPCGGLMPASVMERLDWDFGNLIKHSGSRFSFSQNFRSPIERHIGEGALLLVERSEFDQALVQEAIKRSSGRVSLHEECRVMDIFENQSDVIVQCRSGEGFVARALIGADGVNGVTARKTGLNSDAQNAVAIDMDLDVTMATHDRWAGQVEFNFFCIPNGYGWVFPKEAGRLSVGLLSWDKAGGIRASLEAFVARNLDVSDIIDSTTHGYPIPAYRGISNLSRSRVCLAGDAASLVDPVSGEGIRFAVESGLLAAQKVDEMLNIDDAKAISDGYPTALASADGVWAGLEHSWRFVSLAFNGSPDFFYEHHIAQSNTPFYW